MASAPAAPFVPAPVFYKRYSAVNAPCPAFDATAPKKETRSFATPQPKVAKRKREATGTEDDDSIHRHRKAKKEEQDEQRAELSSARADLDVNRKRWLYANRGLFEPLLPAKERSFFAHLNKEMAGDATPPFPKHEFVSQPELIVGGEMKEYQLEGLSFLANMYHNGINCILGDEMGLGKTLQTLSLFAHIKESGGPALPHLIVCPLSVLSSWEAECARWLPSMRALRFHGTGQERERLKGVIREADVPVDIVVTTYETLSSQDLGWFKTRRWACVVLDEGHRIKNADTDVATRVAAVGGLWRIILTGTPIQNNLTELWGLLHWLYPHIFTQTTRTLFAASFDLGAGTYALPVIDAVRALLAAIQLRRTKDTLTESGALAGVPPREEWTIFIPFTEAQRFWTYRMLTRLEQVDLQALFPPQKDDGTIDEGRREVLKLLENQAKGGAGTSKQWQKFSALLMSLRRICDHPYMIGDAEPANYEIGEHVVAASSKLIAIDKILADVLPKDERVLIFSQWTDMLDLLEDHMALRGIAYLRLDGSTSRARRGMVIRMFQRDDSQYKVFLISTKAGGLGINLTKASTCILCDSDWNPQNDLQAIARSHRIGQTKVVKVYRLICRASVEDQMLDRIRRKLFLSAKIIGGKGDQQSGRGRPEGQGMGGSELMSILRRGSSALTRSDDGMDLARFRTASLQEILKVSRARDDVHEARVKHDLKMEVDGEGKDAAALLRSAEEEEKALLSGVARVQSYLFEGTLLQRSKEPKETRPALGTPQKRERVDRTITIGGMSFILDESMAESDPSTAPAPTKRAKKSTFEWEDYCIGCRDGGEVVICNHCPRVFHAECHPTLSVAQIKANSMVVCGQHSCCKCSRSTSAAGGLILRCQTCPQAFCSDCISWDDIKMVGDTIPEFVLRNFGKRDSVVFIRCAECCELEKIDPQWAQEWEKEIAASQKLVDAM